MRINQPKFDPSGQKPTLQFIPPHDQTSGTITKKRLYTHGEYQLKVNQHKRTPELIIPSIEKLKDMDTTPRSQRQRYTDIKNLRKPEGSSQHIAHPRNERPTSLQHIILARGRHNQQLDVPQQPFQLNFLHTHSSKDIHRQPKDQTDRMQTQREHNHIHSTDKYQLRPPRHQSNTKQDPNTRSQQLFASHKRIGHDRDASPINRKSVEKMWNEVQVDQVILKQAMARESILRSDQRARKYLDRSPQSFTKRMQANNRLNALVRNPDFVEMAEQDLYNLNRVKQYLQQKKTRIRQAPAKSRHLPKNY